jgi:hypothetical protein
MVAYIRADAVRAVRLFEVLPLLVAGSPRRGGLEDRGGESKFFYLNWGSELVSPAVVPSSSSSLCLENLGLKFLMHDLWC